MRVENPFEILHLISDPDRNVLFVCSGFMLQYALVVSVCFGCFVEYCSIEIDIRKIAVE